MRWDDLRFMPHVRRLIQDRGLSFENSFAPYPLCCPSRSSFMTGEYAHNHHVYSHLNPYGFNAFHDGHTIATVLQQAGYRTALVGKYLNGYGQQPVRRTGQPSLHYVPPGWTQWYAGSDHLWPLGDPRFGGGTYDYFDLAENVNGSIHAFPGRYSTDVLADQAREVISRFSRRPAPWFVWWTPVAPHFGLPVEPDDPLPSPRRDGGVTMWGTPARPDWVKGRFDSQVIHGAGTPLTHSAEADVSDKPRYLRRQPELSAAEKHAETDRDAAAGGVALRARRAGRAHACAPPRPRRARRTRSSCSPPTTATTSASTASGSGKITLHEPSLRVPLLLAGPGVPRGRRYDPVSTSTSHPPSRRTPAPGSAAPTAPRCSRWCATVTAGGGGRSSPRG